MLCLLLLLHSACMEAVFTEKDIDADFMCLGARVEVRSSVVA